MCDTHHGGGLNERGLAVASRVCDRAENEGEGVFGIDTPQRTVSEAVTGIPRPRSPRL